MTRASIQEQVQEIFREVFKEKTLEVSDSTNQDDIESWDSLQHAVLIDSVEKYFGIKFGLMDMLDIQNVGDLCDQILSKLEA